MFATIARHKLDVILGIFPEYKNSVSFYTVHADATSYIAPGEKLIQQHAKKDLTQNTKKVIKTLSGCGFDVHVHSK